MTHLTPAERLAADHRDRTLTDIAAASEWDLHVVEQAVYAAGRAGEFSANMLRDVLPEQGHGYLGAAIRALLAAHILERTGQYVPSTSPGTKGHRIAVYRLSARGLQLARPAEGAAA